MFLNDVTWKTLTEMVREYAAKHELRLGDAGDVKKLNDGFFTEHQVVGISNPKFELIGTHHLPSLVFGWDEYLPAYNPLYMPGLNPKTLAYAPMFSFDPDTGGMEGVSDLRTVNRVITEHMDFEQHKKAVAGVRSAAALALSIVNKQVMTDREVEQFLAHYQLTEDRLFAVKTRAELEEIAYGTPAQVESLQRMLTGKEPLCVGIEDAAELAAMAYTKGRELYVVLKNEDDTWCIAAATVYAANDKQFMAAVKINDDDCDNVYSFCLGNLYVNYQEAPRRAFLTAGAATRELKRMTEPQSKFFYCGYGEGVRVFWQIPHEIPGDVSNACVCKYFKKAAGNGVQAEFFAWAAGILEHNAIMLNPAGIKDIPYFFKHYLPLSDEDRQLLIEQFARSGELIQKAFDERAEAQWLDKPGASSWGEFEL